MSAHLNNIVIIANPDESVTSVIAMMAVGGKKCFGISLIVDDQLKLHGVFNNGDVLRLIAKRADLNQPISKVMIREFVVAPEGQTDKQLFELVRTELRKRTNGQKELTQYVPIVDVTGVVLDVVDMFEILARMPRQGERVGIYGMGFVGLTLASALSSRGHIVSGFDTNVKIINQLQDGYPHVFEPRLSEMMRHGLATKVLSFSTGPTEGHNKVIIVAVGTPLGADGAASMDSLRSVCNTVGPRLLRGDIVMLRSTVPVGTTRSIVIPLLEELSGLKIGKGFHVAFCPERTVEGKAINELLTLPQIIGGATEACVERASTFWGSLTNTIVRVESLEAAEFVKLINNSFRDLSFAFSNGLALYADKYNIDATRLIAAANEGYPRNLIPRPSPGVGGYCLTKDPFLYASKNSTAGHAELSRIGRKINEEAARYPIVVLERFAEIVEKTVTDFQILVLGMAFKGMPETNDMRGSVSVEVVQTLMSRGCIVKCFDTIVSEAELTESGFTPANLMKELETANAILILNNHENNVPDKFLEIIGNGRSVLVFDGWNMLDRYEVEKYPGITYANLGYMTNK